MNAEIDISNIVIETERLILRPFNLNDLDDFYDYAKNPNVGPRAGWNAHKDKDESLLILNMFIEGKKTFAIYHKEDKKVIGSIGIEKYQDYYDLPNLDKLKGRELGYALSEEYWGKGIMTEGIKTVIDYCFNELNLDFLLCGRFAENLRSQRVQDKCGFSYLKNIVYKRITGDRYESVLNILYNPKKNFSL